MPSSAEEECEEVVNTLCEDIFKSKSPNPGDFMKTLHMRHTLAASKSLDNFSQIK